MAFCQYSTTMLTSTYRFKQEVLENITGSEGKGPVKTYIHKVSGSFSG